MTANEIVSTLAGPRPTFPPHAREAENVLTARIFQLREAVAAALGGRVTLPFPDSLETVITLDPKPAGLVFSLNFERGKARPSRVIAHGYRPFRGSGPNHFDKACDELGTVRECTAAVERGSDLIAGDIRRKLLPGLTAASKRADELAAAYGDALGQMDAFQADFLSAVPGSRLPHNPSADPHERPVQVHAMRDVRLCCHNGRRSIIMQPAYSLPADIVTEFLQKVAARPES